MGLSLSTRSRVAATALLGGLLLGAAPAQADGDFGDGFENELGRIAAREVVRFGKFVLAGGHGPYYFAQWAALYPAPGYEAYPIHPRRGYRHPVRHRHPHRGAHRPVAVQRAPVYAPPPAYAEPCDQHTEAAPYDERIVYERYERVINHRPYDDRYDRRGVRY